jgi:hypothetical protein
MANNNSPLYIGNEMAAYDRKDRDYYDKFTDEERKQFSTYLMLRYGASVGGNKDLQAYYLMATNKFVNKYFFDLNKHTKLQWLMCTTVSPNMGKQFHYWLAAKKKEGKSTNKLRKVVAELYPNMKSDEMDMFLSMNTEKEIKEYCKELGWNDDRIKSDF